MQAMTPDLSLDLFTCPVLPGHAKLTKRACVLRQEVAQRSRHMTSGWTTPVQVLADYGMCEHCQKGRAHREELVKTLPVMPEKRKPPVRPKAPQKAIGRPRIQRPPKIPKKKGRPFGPTKPPKPAKIPVWLGTWDVIRASGLRTFKRSEIPDHGQTVANINFRLRLLVEIGKLKVVGHPKNPHGGAIKIYRVKEGV